MRMVAIALVTLATALGSAFWQAAARAEPADRAAPNAAGPANEPLLPQNYRRLIAVALLQQYLSDGDGPAEISQPREIGLFRKTPVLIVRFRLSATGARGMLLTFQNPPPRRYRCIEVEADRGVISGNRLMSFKHPRKDPGELCAERVAFEPFVELQQMAGKVQGCRQRGDKQCVIADAVADPSGKQVNKQAKPMSRKNAQGLDSPR